jgi:molybdopterin molybdotransferase
MKPFLKAVSCQEALELVNAFQPLSDEEIPTEQAISRVLSQSVIAGEDCPPFDRSTMDGYAVRCTDTFGASETNPALLQVIGECPMGAMVDHPIHRGSAMRIWTGGALPPQADAVVMVEHTEEVGPEAIEVFKPVAPFENIVRTGEDFRAGAKLLDVGDRLRPQDLGLLAALGCTGIRVFRKVAAALLSSGDEIVPVESVAPPGCMRDANRYILTGAIAEAFAWTRWIGLVPDSMLEIVKGIQLGLDESDVVLISGGSSMGNRDLVVNAILSFPDSEILFHGVSISPGKPLILAKVGNRPVVGLPGHPASAMICFDNFVVPLIRRLSGERIWRPFLRPTIQAVLSRNISSKEGRRDFVRVKLGTDRDNSRFATPISAKSGMISAMVKAHGFFVIEEGCEGLYKGNVVTVHLFSDVTEDGSEEKHLLGHENSRGGSESLSRPYSHERLSRV